MRHISSLKNGVALGSAGVVMMSVLSGCTSQQQEPQNRYLVIEQQPNGKYIVIEEMPTEGPNRAIIREKDENGNTVERFMNEDEMRAMAEQEYVKTLDGSSEAVSSSDSSAEMGLASTILAVAAGALLGNIIGNALMNNKNFASRSASVNKSAYSRSAAARASSASGKKSFFGSSTASTSRTSTYGG